MRTAWISNVTKLVWVSGLVVMAVLATERGRAQNTLFSTGFEPEDGYSTAFDLIDQDGWVGNGGSGIVTNLILGFGQNAYIGFSVPTGSTNDYFYAYRPINYIPTTNAPLIKFSVVMQIADSTSTNWDSFRWSVYNIDGKRLFSIDFDNSSLLVSYNLEDSTNFVSVAKFDTLSYYDLTVSMNLARNVWSATLNDVVIINAMPITTRGTALTIGDIDALWLPRDPGQPGNNFMLFDNYTVTADMAPSIPPRLEALEVRPGGAYQARLYGEPGLYYQIETSTDLVHWQAAWRFKAPDSGMVEFQDPPDGASSLRFYRARQAAQ